LGIWLHFRKGRGFAGISNEFCSPFSQKTSLRFDKIRKAIAFEDIAPQGARQMFQRTLELTGEWLNLDYLPIYTFPAFIAAIVRTIEDAIAHSAQPPFKKNYDFGLRLLPSDQCKFLYSIYHAAPQQKQSHEG
jgi:hypothetical protein